MFQVCGALLPLPLLCGLLGAGTGPGSCAAPPFRAGSGVMWGDGCPDFAPCCSEYGYCQDMQAWVAGRFRDCNTESNGQPLPLTVLQLEYLERLAGRVAAGNDLLGITGLIMCIYMRALYKKIFIFRLICCECIILSQPQLNLNSTQQLGVTRK